MQAGTEEMQRLLRFQRYLLSFAVRNGQLGFGRHSSSANTQNASAEYPNRKRRGFSGTSSEAGGGGRPV